MTLKEEILLKLKPYNPPESDKWSEYMTDEILEIIEIQIDKMIEEESQGSLYHMASDSVLTLKQVKKILK